MHIKACPIDVASVFFLYVYSTMHKSGMAKLPYPILNQ